MKNVLKQTTPELKELDENELKQVVGGVQAEANLVMPFGFSGLHQYSFVNTIEELETLSIGVSVQS